MRWAVVVLAAALALVAIALPWYQALAVNGSSVMAGWGGWSTQGIDAHLVKFPVALLIWIPALWMAAAAVRQRFGAVALAAALATALGVLGYLLRDVFAGHLDGGGAVYVEVLSGPLWVFVLGFIATLLGWFLYSRAILRLRPT